LSRVEVWRGSVIESVHHVSVAVVDASGGLRAYSRDPGLVTFARSAIKPIQALPLIERGAADRYGLDAREIALCCASHSGQPFHVEAALSILRRIGVDATVLACGAHPPFHEPSAAALADRGEEPGRIHNNCSGKHAGMLALACTQGWPVAGYHEASHPVQRLMLETVAKWTDMPEEEIPIAVDGCGVATFALPIERMAAAFARLAAGARRGDAAPSRIVEAMMHYPEYVAGTGRLCSALMRAADGRLIAKTGAEGVYCAGIPGAELGIALKVEDGAKRAAEPMLLAVLGALGLVSEESMADLAEFASPSIRNTRGEIVGAIRASIELQPVE
jgi:L-asparaginase II